MQNENYKGHMGVASCIATRVIIKTTCNSIMKSTLYPPPPFYYHNAFVMSTISDDQIPDIEVHKLPTVLKTKTINYY